MGRVKHWVALMLLTVSCGGDVSGASTNPTAPVPNATATEAGSSSATTADLAVEETIFVSAVRTADLDHVWRETTDTELVTVATSLCAVAAEEAADPDADRSALTAVGRFGYILGGEGDAAEAVTRLEVMLSALTTEPLCDAQAQAIIIEIATTLDVAHDQTPPPAGSGVFSEEGVLAFVSDPASLPAFDARWQGMFTEPLTALEATVSGNCAAVLFRSATLDETAVAMGDEPSAATMFLRWDGDNWLPLSFTLIPDAVSMLNGSSDACL